METRLGNAVLDHKVSASSFSRHFLWNIPMCATEWSSSNRTLTANIQIDYLSVSQNVFDGADVCVGKNWVQCQHWFRFHLATVASEPHFTSCPLAETACLDKGFRFTAKAGLLVGHAGEEEEAIWMERTF